MAQEDSCDEWYQGFGHPPQSDTILELGLREGTCREVYGRWTFDNGVQPDSVREGDMTVSHSEPTACKRDSRGTSGTVRLI